VLALLGAGEAPPRAAPVAVKTQAAAPAPAW
jgi:hypothetical protein